MLTRPILIGAAAVIWFLGASLVGALAHVSAAVPSGTYRGIASDAASVSIVTDGQFLVSFGVSDPVVVVPNQCRASAGGIGFPVGGGSFSIGNSVLDASGVRTDVAYTGFIDQSGTATGTFKADPTSGNPCVARSGSWAAVLDPGSTPPAQGTFTGTTDKGGIVSFRTSGSAIAAISVALPGGCPVIATNNTFQLTGNNANIGAQSAGGFLRFYVSGDRAVGAYATATPAPAGCTPAVGTFSAKLGGSATTTPTPAPGGGSTGGIVGSVPGTGAAGLLVTGGAASPAQLIADLGGRGCNVGALAVLQAGTWSIYINGAPAIVNSAFPASLAASTPFYLRCA